MRHLPLALTIWAIGCTGTATSGVDAGHVEPSIVPLVVQDFGGIEGNTVTVSNPIPDRGDTERRGQ